MTGWWPRTATRLIAAATLTSLTVGVPTMLTVAIGWPLPTALPGWEQTATLLTSPPSGQLLLNVVAVVCWLLWGLFVVSLLADLAWMVRHGPRRPARQLPARGFTFALLAALLSGSFGGTATALLPPAPGGLATIMPSHVEAAAANDQQVPRPDTGRRHALWRDPPLVLPDHTEPTTILASTGQSTHSVEVNPGDTLWDLAQRWLGDPTRWPEIEEINQHEYQMRGGWLLRPGWVLLLPDDAAPPENTTEAGQTEQPQLTYKVAAGDWMWHIAGRYLGDETRYTEIAALNPDLAQQHDHFPDHIQAGDLLHLPDDAYDRGSRPHATGQSTPTDTTPAPPPPAPPSHPETQKPDTHQPGQSGGTLSPGPPPASIDPDTVVPPPDASTTTRAAADSTPLSPTSTAPAPADSGQDETNNAPPGEHGVDLDPHSWIPWALATAIMSAAAVVWLQRRRRYTPRPLDREPDTELPPAGSGTEPAALTRIRRALRLRASHPEPFPHPEPATDHQPEPTDAEADPAGVGQPAPPASGDTPTDARAAPGPGIAPLPDGGLGLVGPGAHAAARGALIAALSSGSAPDPDAQTEVVVPADTMVTLLGADAVELGGWRRLRITADLDAALAVVESRLLATARLLDDYELTDLPALRRAAPAERPVPPLLLLAADPPSQQRMRTRTVLGLGHGVDVSALLLGGWEHGPTVHVEHDGTCQPASPTGGDGSPARMAVVDQTAALQLLYTLREAHTGEAPNDEKTPVGRDNADTHIPQRHQPAAASEDATGEHTDTPTGTAQLPKAVIRVLGTPRIDNVEAAQRPLRKASLELMVYLAVHPDGAEPDRLLEQFWPESRRRLAATKLHTAASNLRHLLAAAAGADDEQAKPYVAKHHGRYLLPEQAVEVDLWTMRQECARARRSTDPHQRVEALRRACQSYGGELAAGRDYEWIVAHREAARRLALDAHTTLADALADQDPQEAARLLLQAVRIDPMAETVYRKAMRACHRIGDSETIRTLVRDLSRQLDAVGAEPAESTLELAETLRAELNH